MSRLYGRTAMCTRTASSPSRPKPFVGEPTRYFYVCQIYTSTTVFCLREKLLMRFINTF